MHTTFETGRALSLAVLAALAACEETPPCATGFVGDPAQLPEAVMLVTDGASYLLSEVRAGDAVPLEPPPQGGYVIYAAARVRNMDGCGIEFRGELLDVPRRRQLGFDARTTHLVVGDDGWGRPDPSNNANLANVNACPHYTDRDLHGEPYTLRVTVTDRGGRSVAVTREVVPTCMLADAAARRDCVCTCGRDYTLGKCALADGGGEG